MKRRSGGLRYSVALLSVGLAMELFSSLYRREALGKAGRWMLLVGALSCVPAAMSGIYAYYDTVRHVAQSEAGVAPANEAWYWLTRAAQERLTIERLAELKHHVWWTASATVMVMVGVIAFLGASDRWRRRLYGPCLAMIVFGVGVMLWGAWFAGGHRSEWVRGMLGPIQMHLLLAGWMVSMALVGLGVSARRLSAGPADAVRTVPGAALADAPRVIRPGWFWLVALVLGVGTMVAGLWMAGWSARQLLALAGQPRDVAHAIFGSAIMILIVALAALTRRGKRRWTIALSALFLILLLGVQMWVGILLLYDGSDGGVSWYRFREAVVQRP